MVFIDGTVVNVALPVLQKEFSASLADASWVVESYALLLAALMLVGVAVFDLLGRERAKFDEILDARNTLQLDLHNLPAGTYYLEIQPKEGVRQMLKIELN